MVKKRRLSPKSVWDEADLTEAFIEEGIKEYHVQKLHRHFRWLHQGTTILTLVCDTPAGKSVQESP